MNYRIKPEYADLWGEDVTEDTVISETDHEMIARGWEKDPEELKEQLIEMEDDGMKVFEGYTPDGIRCEVVLADDGFLYVVTADGRERFSEEMYDGDEDFRFMLIHEGFRGC